MALPASRVRLIASSSSWIEGEAIRQLEASAALPGVRWVVGMPDLHPGKGHPVGIAAMADGVVYPHLVGADIGCGMALFTTRTPVRKLDVTRAAKHLRGLEEPWGEDPEAFLAEQGVGHRGHLNALGTMAAGTTSPSFREWRSARTRKSRRGCSVRMTASSCSSTAAHEVSASRRCARTPKPADQLHSRRTPNRGAHTSRRTTMPCAGDGPIACSSPGASPRCWGWCSSHWFDPLSQRGAALRRWMAAPEGRGPA